MIASCNTYLYVQYLFVFCLFPFSVEKTADTCLAFQGHLCFVRMGLTLDEATQNTELTKLKAENNHEWTKIHHEDLTKRF